MKRIDAGNLLMVSAAVIVALHTGLFSIWVDALKSGLFKLANGIAITGAIFIVCNGAAWIVARQNFDGKIRDLNEESPLSWWVSSGLIAPFAVILIGWIICAWYAPSICGDVCKIQVTTCPS